MIPKIIHYCWLSGEPFPKHIAKCIQSWKTYLPDYEFVCWDTNKIDISGSVWLSQSIKTKKYAFASDFIRFYALYHFGGIYLDADVEILGSLDPFLIDQAFIGLDYSNDFEPAIIGAQAGHKWINQLLDYYTDRSFIKENGKPDTRPLPAIVKESAQSLFEYRPENTIQKIVDYEISIYPYDYFSPKSWYLDTLEKTINTVAIHHFEGSWLNKTGKYRLKRLVHQSLFRLGGKAVHDNVIQAFRKIAL
jgi:mannosyltransferase OCH1-like enzyme